MLIKKGTLDIILVVLCMFPFCGFNIGTDIQPFALVSALLLIIKKQKIRMDYAELLFVFIGIVVMGIGISLMVISPFKVLKRAFSYISIICIPIAVYNMDLDIESEKFELLMKICMLIWMGLAIIQVLYDRSFGKIIVPLMRTTDNRGVCSFASEPSFYGYTCFIFFLIALFFKRQKKLFVIINLLQIVLLAQSSVTIIYVSIFFACYVVSLLLEGKPDNIVKIVVLFVVIGVGIAAIIQKYGDSRMGYLISQFLRGDIDVLLQDQSIQERLSDIILSFSRKGAVSYIGNITIMSGFGGVLYELGVFSLILFIIIWRRVKKGNTLKMQFPIIVSLTACVFSAVQLSSPLLSFYIGLCMIKGRKNSEYSKIALTDNKE